jgi:hypothetical protein
MIICVVQTTDLRYAEPNNVRCRSLPWAKDEAGRSWRGAARADLPKTQLAIAAQLMLFGSSRRSWSC